MSNERNIPSNQRLWSPTSERMPVTREYVIGWYQPGLSVRIVCFVEDTGMWCERYASPLDPILRRHITHWMPLPEQPI